MTPAWYRKKSYPHFDLPMSAADAIRLVTDPDRVASHGFHPFLAFNITRRRYRSVGKRGIVTKKPRPIRVAAHRDGYIFAYYAALLSERYDAYIAGSPIADVSLAYRKGLGSNISFADAAFREVSSRNDCVAVALDLEGFFDSLDHELLKKMWARVLGVSRLPKDHFAVFRALTRYAYVDRDACLAALGIAADPPKHPICTPAQYRGTIRGGGLVQVNGCPYGIPQGSAMSSVLSNIYMLDFDAEMAALAKATGSYYRRYCDDILWITSDDHLAAFWAGIAAALGRAGTEVTLNNDKTAVSEFRGGRLVRGAPLQYLGFTFDGVHRRIRSQTLSRYWRKVIYGVRAAKNRARKAALAGKAAPVFKRKLYRRFTHLGKRNFLS
jgi:RNA-directed DNA polymerase